MSTTKHYIDQSLTLIRGHLLPRCVRVVLERTAETIIVSMMEQVIVGLIPFHLTLNLLFLICSTLTQIHFITESSAHGGDSTGFQGRDSAILFVWNS